MQCLNLFIWSFELQVLVVNLSLDYVFSDKVIFYRQIELDFLLVVLKVCFKDVVSFVEDDVVSLEGVYKEIFVFDKLVC